MELEDGMLVVVEWPIDVLEVLRGMSICPDVVMEGKLEKLTHEGWWVIDNNGNTWLANPEWIKPEGVIRS